MLSILDILEDTTVDGPGFRTAIYAAGCPNGCPGCHNPESWDINRGHWMSTEEILEKVLADNFADVTFSGGDPMSQPKIVHCAFMSGRKHPGLISAALKPSHLAPPSLILLVEISTTW